MNAAGECRFPGSDRCGTNSTYVHYECRSEPCREANRIDRGRVASEPPDPIGISVERLRLLYDANIDTAWLADARCAELARTAERDGTVAVNEYTSVTVEELRDAFFPARGESIALARGICGGCPVRQPCLDFAITTSEKFGIWGGLSERERRRVRRQRNQDRSLSAPHREGEAVA